MLRRLVFPVFLTCSALVGRAELVWTNPVQELSVLADVAEVQVRFEFQNTGTKPVKVVQLGASCHCTTPRAEPPEVAPGATGVITASIRIEAMPGKFRRSLFVLTDDNPNVVNLDIDLTVRPLVAFTPRLTWWKEGEAKAAKDVKVLLAEPERMRVVGVRSEQPGFAVAWVPGADGAGVVRIEPSREVADVQTKIYVDYERGATRGTAFFFATVP